SLRAAARLTFPVVRVWRIRSPIIAGSRVRGNGHSPHGIEAIGSDEEEGRIMRHGLTGAPAGLVLLLTLLGAGPDVPTNEVTVLDERFGIRTAPILLLARPDVQLDLRLDPQQVSGAKRTIAQLVERVLSLKNQAGPPVLAGRQAIDEDMARWLSRNLQPGQLERLRQIDLQWEGALAISRPVVAESLKLTVEQRLA